MLLFYLHIVCKYFPSYQLYLFIPTANPPTFPGNLDRMPAQYKKKENDSREIALLAGAKASRFQVINLT